MKLITFLFALMAFFPTVALAADWQPNNPLGIDLGSPEFCPELMATYPFEEPAISRGSNEVFYLTDPQKIIPNARKIHVLCNGGRASLLSIIIGYEHSYLRDKERLLKLLGASFDRSFACPEQPIPSDACAIFIKDGLFVMFTANEQETGYALTYSFPEDPASVLERIQRTGS